MQSDERIKKTFDAGRLPRKVMACMVLGIPMKKGKILAYLEYGTTAETLGFHAGTFTRNAEDCKVDLEARACGKGSAAC